MSIDTCQELVEKEMNGMSDRIKEHDTIMAELYIVLLNFIICFANMVNSKICEKYLLQQS